MEQGVLVPSAEGEVEDHSFKRASSMPEILLPSAEGEVEDRSFKKRASSMPEIPVPLSLLVPIAEGEVKCFHNRLHVRLVNDVALHSVLLHGCVVIPLLSALARSPAVVKRVGSWADWTPNECAISCGIHLGMFPMLLRELRALGLVVVGLPDGPNARYHFAFDAASVLESLPPFDVVRSVFEFPWRDSFEVRPSCHPHGVCFVAADLPTIVIACVSSCQSGASGQKSMQLE